LLKSDVHNTQSIHNSAFLVLIVHTVFEILKQRSGLVQNAGEDCETC